MKIFVRRIKQHVAVDARYGTRNKKADGFSTIYPCITDEATLGRRWKIEPIVWQSRHVEGV